MEGPRKRAVLRATIWVLVAGVVLVALAVAGAAVFLPGCAYCHMKGSFATATDASVHSSVACAACHVDGGVIARASYGFRIVFGMLVPIAPSTGRAAAEPSDSACLRCHERIDDTVVSSGGLRILHSECGKGRSCVDCHSTVAHGAQTTWPRSYDMDTCIGCHGETGAPVRCDACHEQRKVEDRLVSGPWTVTHGPQWRTTHGMGNPSTCAVCHAADYCARCHGVGVPHVEGYSKLHSKDAVSGSAQCTSCHPQKFCLDCHGLPMPHPADFANGHAESVKRNGDTVCKTCHTPRDCTICHEMHVHPGGALKSGPVTR